MFDEYQQAFTSKYIVYVLTCNVLTTERLMNTNKWYIVCQYIDVQCIPFSSTGYTLYINVLVVDVCQYIGDIPYSQTFSREYIVHHCTNHCTGHWCTTYSLLNICSSADNMLNTNEGTLYINALIVDDSNYEPSSPIVCWRRWFRICIFNNQHISVLIKVQIMNLLLQYLNL